MSLRATSKETYLSGGIFVELDENRQIEVGSESVCLSGRFSFTLEFAKNVKKAHIKNMPRPPRLLLSHSFCHIMTRGNNRNVVFKKPEDYQYYLDLIAKYKKELPFNLYHYCLMPTHIHMQVQTNNCTDFSGFMKRLNLVHFHHYRQNYGWVGHFWQGRFKSQPVGKDEYFIQCGKYIESNLVRAKLVQKPEDYPYSSYQHYVSGKKDPLLTEDFLYQDLGQTLGKRQKEYHRLIIGDIVKENYLKGVWAAKSQSHNEKEKIRYHFRTKS